MCEARHVHTHLHARTHSLSPSLAKPQSQGHLTAELKRLQLRADDTESADTKSDVHTAQRHAREASEALKKLEKAHAISLKDRDALRQLLDTFASEEPSDKEKVLKQRISTCIITVLYALLSFYFV